MARYRAKPVELEAVQWTGDNVREIKAFAGDDIWAIDGGYLCVATSEGDTTAPAGHYIVRDDRGNHYPCDPGVFERKYEAFNPGDAGSPLAHKRATGRTTRMLKEALAYAVGGRAVYIVAAGATHACWLSHRLKQLLEEAGDYTPPHQLGIKFETPGSSSGFDFETMTPPRGAHSNCVWLVDHHTVECAHHRVLETWVRYDR